MSCNATCADDPKFVGPFGFACSDWHNNCGDSIAVTQWGYTKAQASQIRAACPLACGICRTCVWSGCFDAGVDSIINDTLYLRQPRRASHVRIGFGGWFTKDLLQTLFLLFVNEIYGFTVAKVASPSTMSLPTAVLEGIRDVEFEFERKHILNWTHPVTGDKLDASPVGYHRKTGFFFAGVRYQQCNPVNVGCVECSPNTATNGTCAGPADSFEFWQSHTGARALQIFPAIGSFVGPENKPRFIPAVCRANSRKCMELLADHTSDEQVQIENLVNVTGFPYHIMYMGWSFTRDAVANLSSIGRGVVFSWFEPDPFLVKHSAVRIAFPYYLSSCANSRGFGFTIGCDRPLVSLVNMVADSLKHRIPDIYHLIKEKFRITEQQLTAMMRTHVLGGGNFTSVNETACQWMRSNTATIRSWVHACQAGTIPYTASNGALVCCNGTMMTVNPADNPVCVPRCDNATQVTNIQAQTCDHKCAPGYVLNSGLVKVPPCVACAKGRRWRQVTGQIYTWLTFSECSKCPPGRYSAIEASTFCIDCSAGKYTSLHGSTACLDCPPGSQQPRSGSQQCSQCLPGRFSHAVGSSHCLDCDIGKYCERHNCTACESCSIGKSTEELRDVFGALTLVSFNGAWNRTQCVCKVGTIQDNHRADVCLLNIPIGIFGPFDTEPFGHEMLAAAIMFDLDFRKNFESAIAQRFGAPIVNITNLNDTLRLHVRIVSDKGDPAEALRVTGEMLTNLPHAFPVVGFVGGLFSRVSLPVAQYVALRGVPQISYGASSPDLSSYSYHFRTIPSDIVQAAAMWSWFEYFQLLAVTFVYSQEKYGQGLWSGFSSKALSSGVLSRVSEMGIRDTTLTNLQQEAIIAVDKLTRFGNRFIIVACISTVARVLLSVLETTGILHDLYQVLVSEGVAEVVDPSYLQQQLPIGFLRLQPRGTGVLYQRFLQMWNMMQQQDIYDSATLKRYGFGRLQLNASGSSPVQFNNTPRSFFLPFLFDACYAFIAAFNQLLNTGVAVQDIRGNTLREKLSNISFLGISGHVHFNATTGDRTIPFELMNVQWVQGTGSARIYRKVADLDGTLVRTSAKLYWAGGTEGESPPSVLRKCPPNFQRDPVTLLCTASSTHHHPSNSGMSTVFIVAITTGAIISAITVMMVIQKARHHVREKRLRRENDSPDNPLTESGAFAAKWLEEQRCKRLIKAKSMGLMTHTESDVGLAQSGSRDIINVWPTLYLSGTRRICDLTSYCREMASTGISRSLQMKQTHGIWIVNATDFVLEVGGKSLSKASSCETVIGSTSTPSGHRSRYSTPSTPSGNRSRYSTPSTPSGNRSIRLPPGTFEKSNFGVSQISISNAPVGCPSWATLSGVHSFGVDEDIFRNQGDNGEFESPVARLPLPDGPSGARMGSLKLVRGPRDMLLVVWSPPPERRGVPLTEFEFFLESVVALKDVAVEDVVSSTSGEAFSEDKPACQTNSFSSSPLSGTVSTAVRFNAKTFTLPFRSTTNVFRSTTNVARRKGTDGKGRDKNMYDACKMVLEKQIAPLDASYAELRTDYGPPDIFVSHVWNETAKNTLRAVRAFKRDSLANLLSRPGSRIRSSTETSPSERRPSGDGLEMQAQHTGESTMSLRQIPQNCRLWFCTICNNQFRVAGELGTDGVNLSPFARVIGSPLCQTVAVVSPLLALKRKWCNFEFSIAKEQNKRVLLVTTHGIVQTGQVPPVQLHALATEVTGFHCRHATCFNRSDALMIDDAIKKVGGYSYLDRSLKREIYAAIREAHQQTSEALQEITEHVSSNSIGGDGDSDAGIASMALPMELDRCVEALEAPNEVGETGSRGVLSKALEAPSEVGETGSRELDMERHASKEKLIELI